jgi:hypothetical protein
MISFLEMKNAASPRLGDGAASAGSGLILLAARHRAQWCACYLLLLTRQAITEQATASRTRHTMTTAKSCSGRCVLLAEDCGRTQRCTVVRQSFSRSAHREIPMTSFFVHVFSEKKKG